MFHICGTFFEILRLWRRGKIDYFFYINVPYWSLLGVFLVRQKTICKKRIFRTTLQQFSTQCLKINFLATIVILKNPPHKLYQWTMFILDFLWISLPPNMYMYIENIDDDAPQIHIKAYFGLFHTFEYVYFAQRNAHKETTYRIQATLSWI